MKGSLIVGLLIFGALFSDVTPAAPSPKPTAKPSSARPTARPTAKPSAPTAKPSTPPVASPTARPTPEPTTPEPSPGQICTRESFRYQNSCIFHLLRQSQHSTQQVFQARCRGEEAPTNYIIVNPVNILLALYSCFSSPPTKEPTPRPTPSTLISPQQLAEAKSLDFFNFDGLYDKSWFMFLLVTVFSATLGRNYVFTKLQIPVITGAPPTL